MPERHVQRPRAPRLAVLLAAIAIALVLGSSAPPARAAAYNAFYANFAGEELMRAINADRAALGLPRLATDATLEVIARNRGLACPSNTSLIIRGRADDMAARDYLSHTIKGCYKSNGSAFTAFDLLHAFGYSYSAAGEDISDNDYPSSAVTYQTGCNLYGASCHGSTVLPWTVAVAERAFMSSSAHRANLLSTSNTQFGCAAWRSGAGYNYYSCYFTRYGNGHLDGAGPSIWSISDVGATLRAGTTPIFTATAGDALSLLSDGYAALDGRHLKNWAFNHAGSSNGISVTLPALTAGSHTFTWWVRDTSTHARAVTFVFYVIV